MKGNPAGGPVDEYAGVVEYLRVFHHAGFFFLHGGGGILTSKDEPHG